jgi:hypothetical protein
MTDDIEVTYDDGRSVGVHAVLTMGAHLCNVHRAVTIALEVQLSALER